MSEETTREQPASPDAGANCDCLTCRLNATLVAWAKEQSPDIDATRPLAALAGFAGNMIAACPEPTHAFLVQRFVAATMTAKDMAVLRVEVHRGGRPAHGRPH